MKPLDIKRNYQLHDEPKLFQYSTTVDIKGTDGHDGQVIRATGASFTDDAIARKKCEAEAIERYACAYYKNDRFTRASYNEIGEYALDPLSVIGMSDEQKHKYPEYDITHDTVINWVEGYSGQNGESIFIPASLIYFNYKLTEGEKYIYRPISTGAAAYTTMLEAISRGYLEVAERDAFMLAYFSKEQRPRVDYKKTNHPTVNKILDLVKRYRLTIHSIELTNDTGIPVFTSIVCDDTGHGPATLVGLGSSDNPMDALISSMEEAVRARSWIRIEKSKNPEPIKNITTAVERGLYWYDKDMRRHLNFWLKSPVATVVQNKVLDIQSVNHYWVGLTPPESKLYVAKVVAPGLHPFCIVEDYIPMGGNRIIDNNKIPNPFI